MNFNRVNKDDWQFLLLVLALAASIFLLAHVLWFLQTPVWYPFRCFLTGLPVTFFLFCPVFLSKRFSKIWITGMTVILLVPAVMAGMHLFFYGATISQQSLYAIFESNISESIEFLLSQLSFTGILFFLSLLAVPLFFAYKAVRKIDGIEFSHVRIFGMVFLIIAAGLSFSGKLERLEKDNIACQLVRSIKAYRASIKDLEQYMSYAAKLRAPDVVSRHDEMTLVVLIGESSSRHHWGLYGYFRDTTPKLKAMERELTVFDDAISPFGRTTLSVAAALTCKDVPSVGDIPLVNVFRQAGFETIWVSNQSTVDDTNMVVRLISGADRQMYLNKGGDQAYARAYDEKILPVLDELLTKKSEGKKRVVFVHSMGSHVNYASRYPEEFARFKNGDDIQEKPWFTGKAKKYINNYDNSILYTDHIIASVIERLRTVPNSALLYFSDHGEEVFDTRKHHGHHDSIESRYYVDIPFLVWLSPSYKDRMTPEEKDRMEKAVHSAFVNDAAPYIILDLCGVSFRTPHGKTSPLSPEFMPSPRIIHGINYDLRYPGEEGLKKPVDLQ